jgi:hypothetical protein
MAIGNPTRSTTSFEDLNPNEPKNPKEDFIEMDELPIYEISLTCNSYNLG